MEEADDDLLLLDSIDGDGGFLDYSLISVVGQEISLKVPSSLPFLNSGLLDD